MTSLRDGRCLVVFGSAFGEHRFNVEKMLAIGLIF